LNAVNNWILPFILFLSLTLFFYYLLSSKGEMDRREKRCGHSLKKNSLAIEKKNKSEN